MKVIKILEDENDHVYAVINYNINVAIVSYKLSRAQERNVANLIEDAPQLISVRFDSNIDFLYHFFSTL